MKKISPSVKEIESFQNKHLRLYVCILAEEDKCFDQQVWPALT